MTLISSRSTLLTQLEFRFQLAFVYLPNTNTVGNYFNGFVTLTYFCYKEKWEILLHSVIDEYLMRYNFFLLYFTLPTWITITFWHSLILTWNSQYLKALGAKVIGLKRCKENPSIR